MHGILDRFAALDLLRWAKYGIIPSQIDINDQKAYLESLSNILNAMNCEIVYEKDKIFITHDNIKKQIEIYPAMWHEPKSREEIFLSDAYLKYAKPYCIDAISKAMDL